MRRLLHGDLVAAARVLLGQPPEGRPAVLARMLDAADRAEAHVARTGRAHPLWGAGCLETAAAHWPMADERWLDDPAYAVCLAMVLGGVARRRSSSSGPNSGPNSGPDSGHGSGHCPGW